jgi:hypothetical protein
MTCAACGTAAKKMVDAVVVLGPGLAKPGKVCGPCASTGVLIVVGDDRVHATADAPVEPQTPTKLPKLEKIGLGLREVTRAPRATSARRAPERLANGEGALRILAHIAQNGVLTRGQISLFSGYKRDMRNKYLRQLERDGLVVLDGDSFVVTPQGMQTAEGFDVPRRGQQLREWWIGRLSEGERRVFDLFTARTDIRVWLSRDEISNASGYKRDMRNKYLRQLLGHGVIVEEHRGFRGAEELFE